MQWTEFLPHIAHLPVAEHARIQQGFELGRAMHDGQRRKSGEPYYTHPIAVAEILCNLGADADTVIAALLHDTIEDTPLTLSEIEAQFGAKVALLVEGVTKLQAADVAASPNADEQIETVRKIFTLMQSDVRIMVIKLADRLHNMRTIDSLKPERAVALAEETRDIYVKIADRLCMQDERDELEAACLRVLEPVIYKDLLALKEHNTRENTVVLERMRAIIGACFPKQNLPVSFEQESHAWSHLRRLLAMQGVGTGTTTAIIVCVCPSIEECYRTLGTLHQIWRRETGSFQDYINSPQLNGYRGLHTTVILKDGTRVRCRIRTTQMQHYARFGVTALCFSEHATRLLDALPWTNRISPLSTDTADRSEDFWESLQNDILGESMTIHGPGDESVQVPKGATALDGLFYLLGDEARYASHALVNGQERPFDAPLAHSDTVAATLADTPAITREWLQYVRTGFGTARIRTALSERSEQERIRIGRGILDRELSAKRMGFLEEFNTTTLESAVTQLGYTGMPAAFMAIADGHLQPETLVTELAGVGSKRGNREKTYIISYSYANATEALPGRLSDTHNRYSACIGDVRVRYVPSLAMGMAHIRLRACAQDSERFIAELRAAGAADVRSSQTLSPYHYTIGVIILIAAWGADPVLARAILQMGIMPSDLVLIRLWSVAVCIGITTLLTTKRGTFRRIPLSDPSLWLASAALVGVSFLTYNALELTSAGIYNTVMRGNTVLIATPVLLQMGLFSRGSLAWGFTLAGLFMLATADGGMGLWLSVLVLLLFAIYTFASSHFHRVAHIQARKSQFLLIVNGIAGVLSLPLLWQFGIHWLTWPQISAAVLFSIGCVAVPYYVFDLLTARLGYLTISRYINLSLVVTLALETVLLGDAVTLPIALAGLLFIAGNLVSALDRGSER